MNAELIAQTEGQLKFQFYFGAGDEKGSVERLRSGQYDAVALTGVGLQEILPELIVLHLPMLFSNYEELDHVKDKLTQRVSQQFNEAGYEFLGWGDYGFIHLFSSQQIRTQTDLQRTKLWVWDEDAIAKSFASRSGGSPVLLPIHSVLASLESGDIQTLPGSPLTCIALQWHPYINYMTDLPLSAGVGATIMDKSRFDNLRETHQSLLKRTAEDYHLKLIDQVREENERSLEVLTEQGMVVIPVPQRERMKWIQVAEQVHEQFADVVYPRELLEEVKRELKEYRQGRE
jgi:TRAP-type C4-dicarboxylate transport system substrate-binding protein